MNVADIQIRDPFIVADRSSRRYFMFGTTGFGGAAEAPEGFVVRTSTDLREWSEPRVAFARDPGFWGRDFFWAPEVHAYRGRHYLLGSFTRGTDGMNPLQRGTQILVADEIGGPFAPLSKGPVTPADWPCIDGTLHVDAQGVPWMVFVREWLQVKDGEMHAQQLAADLTSTVGSPHLLFRASEAPWSLPQAWERSPGCRITDGPWLHRLASGELLMIWSTVGNGGYVTGLATSASGTVLGPWIQADSPLFAGDGGHAMLFRTFEGQLTMALHSPNAVGRERARFLPVREIPGGLALLDAQTTA